MIGMYVPTAKLAAERGMEEGGLTYGVMYRDQGTRSTGHLAHCRRDQFGPYRIGLVDPCEKQDGDYM